ncbi:hypothetical protein C0J52_01099 [Blattella germanica]|nr:hypothetical protein C0J52_01099 [Blattella germanica]
MLPAAQRGVYVGGDARNPFHWAVADTIAFKILPDGPHFKKSGADSVMDSFSCATRFSSHPGSGF